MFQILKCMSPFSICRLKKKSYNRFKHWRVSKAASLAATENEALRKFNFLNKPFIKSCVDEEKFRKLAMHEKMKVGGF